MAESKRIRRRRQRDALVAIKSDHLRAAMELDGWTVTSLAAKLGKRENPQTLHHLALGTGLKRCRASRRAALARVLEVPEEWLAGEPYGLPLLGVMPMLREVEGSPRVLLAVGRLFRRCAEALQRDLDREPKRPDLAMGWNATTDIYGFMFRALGTLLSPARWQSALTHPTQQGPTLTLEEYRAQIQTPPDLVKWFEPLDPSMWAPKAKAKALDSGVVEATLGFIRGWLQNLQPWFEGTATFDYQRFWELSAALNPAVSVSLPQSFHERPPVDSLPPAEPTSPYWLVDWPLKDRRKPADTQPS